MPSERAKRFYFDRDVNCTSYYSILILLFVPNLIKEKSQVQKTGEAAVVKVVESQAQLYELDHDDEKPSLPELLSAGMITQKQISAYDNYYDQNKNEERNFND